MIKYYNPFKDNNGYIHSVDNVVCWYYVCSIDSVLDSIHELRDICKVSPSDYWEQLNKMPCVKYDYFLHHIHLGSIYIKLGKYKERIEGKTKQEDKWSTLSIMSVEVNPNKHSDSQLFKMTMDMIKILTYDGYLSRIDYAIDVPYVQSDVVVLNSRKMRGLYKGTEYFGQRSQNGFVRIYDKAKESDLDSPLTRIETVVRFGKKKKFSSVDFGVVTSGSSDVENSDLSCSNKVLVQALLELEMYGSDIRKYIDKLDRRLRLKVEPYIHGQVKVYQPVPDILDNLLVGIRELFHLGDVPDNHIVTDDEFDFEDCDDDELPF